MNPRRLIPYLLVFLVVAGAYVGLRWHSWQQTTREERAKEIYNFKEAEITAFSLKRPKEEIQVSRQGTGWEITKPLKTKADVEDADELAKALARLKMLRDLGPGDFKAFGLEPPGLVVSFTAKGEQHQLALGQAVPGGRAYYVRKDNGPNILLIATGFKDSLDQQLTALRDKTLWPFKPAEVKALKIKTEKVEVNLEKTDANTWRWVGRTGFRVRADRVAQLLQRLSDTGVMAFNPPKPKDLRAAGLAPQAKTQVTLMTPQGAETLFLGGQVEKGIYARLGAQGELVQVNRDEVEQIARTVEILEDRRLWSGAVTAVHKIVWGEPGKTWTAVKEQNSWKLTGPDGAEFTKAAPLVEMALVNFQNLEYSSLLPQVTASGPANFAIEFCDGTGKPLLRLEEWGKPAESAVQIRAQSGDIKQAALVILKNFTQWQEEMNRLTTPPPKPAEPAK